MHIFIFRSCFKKLYLFIFIVICICVILLKNGVHTYHDVDKIIDNIGIATQIFSDDKQLISKLSSDNDILNIVVSINHLNRTHNCKQSLANKPVENLSCNFISETANNISKVTNQDICNCPPETLEGQFQGNFTIYKEKYLFNKYPDIKPGGEWWPDDCVPREKIAVLVPFKNRTQHIPAMLNALHPFLRRQKLHYRIFIINQVSGTIFNKGKTFNAGAREILKLGYFDCLILHDIDMLPENDWNFYTCGMNSPVHLSSRIDRSNYKYHGRYSTGGVLAIKPAHFRQANGFSNLYNGWGGEDDDFNLRLRAANLKLRRVDTQVACYTSLQHSRDNTFPKNNQRSSILNQAKKKRKAGTIFEEGLSSIYHKMQDVEDLPLFTKIDIRFI